MSYLFGGKRAKKDAKKGIKGRVSWHDVCTTNEEMLTSERGNTMEKHKAIIDRLVGFVCYLTMGYLCSAMVYWFIQSL